MSNITLPKLADFELLVARSDGFLDAQWKLDGERVLLRKLQPEGGLTPAIRLQIERDRLRAESLTEPGALELLASFEDGDALYFALTHFYGRAVSVQIARGRRFSFSEAIHVVRSVGQVLLRCNAVHGAILPANVLLNDQKEVRIVPALHCAPVSGIEANLQTDLRQAALLIGHLVFGKPQASANDEGRALTNWILKPEMPVQFRTVLQLMLAPAGPHYTSWKDCLRDLDRASRDRPVSTTPRSSGARRPLVLAAVAAVAVAGAWSWWWAEKPHHAPQITASPQVTRIAPPDISFPASLEPVAEGTAQEIRVTADDPEALADYTRLMGDAIKLCASRNYQGATALLQRWLDKHPDAANRRAVERQVDRIQMAQAALGLVFQHGAELAGATADLPDGAKGKLVKIADGRFIFDEPTTYGTVAKTFELSALSDAALAGLLGRLDSVSGSHHAAQYLLGAAHFNDARASLSKASNKQDALHAWADDWQKLRHQREGLDAMDRLASLIASGDHVAAATELQRLRTEFADVPFVTKSRLYDWDQRIAALDVPKTPAATRMEVVAAYPGLPKLSLSSAVGAGDPEYKQLVAATHWAIDNHGWQQHRDALEGALVAAASSGNWTQYAGNLERVLALKAPSLMLSQNTVLHAVDSSAIGELPNDKDTADFLDWLFATPRAVEMLAETIRPEDKPRRVLEIWRDCWKEDRQDPERYMALALAIAVVFDDPVSVNPNFYAMNAEANQSESDKVSRTNIDPVERYRFYRDAAKRGELRTPLAELRPFDLVWMVDAPVPTSELVWAEKNVNLSRRDWGKAYGMIRYRMDKAAGGRTLYDHYTLAEIREKGGVCVDQAYFASVTAKANGIPAMIIGGEGDRGAHAWFGYEATRNSWNLSTGRYDDHFAAGATVDPQTHRTLKEQELRELGEPARRTDGWATTERYLQLADLLAKAKMPEISRLALDAAVSATPQHLGAWNRRLDAMQSAKVGTDDWEREIGRMRVVFQKYPDVVESINKRETDYLMANGDTKAAFAAAEHQENRLERKDKDRTDLILDSVYKEVALAKESGDDTAPGKIYRDALREKGKEFVAFKALAPRYYDWAKDQHKGAEAAREIDQTFERNFKTPTSDYFAMGAWRDASRVVINLLKKEGLDTDAHQLERKSDKVEEKRKEIGEQSRKQQRE